VSERGQLQAEEIESVATTMVHRNLHDKLPEHLGKALDDYRTMQGYIPPKVTVHQSQVERAREILREMDVVNVTVEGLGGCLANEVWLWLPDEDDDT
jgi:hypothetical protein